MKWVSQSLRGGQTQQELVITLTLSVVRMPGHSGRSLVLLASLVILSLGRAVRGEQRLENWFNPKLNITPPSPCGACGVTEIENFDKLSPFAEHRTANGWFSPKLGSYRLNPLLCLWQFLSVNIGSCLKRHILFLAFLVGRRFTISSFCV